MTSFLTLFNSLSPDSHIKGKQFEIIAKWFLENDSVQQAQISQVWLWDDYPQRWGKDRGIDLVCEFKDGSHWAVQAKCYQSNHSLKKADIDSFLSESKCF